MVVGAAGFIGQAVVNGLLAQGCRVLAIALPAQAAVMQAVQAEVMLADAQSADWATVLRPGDVVHYYAWSWVPASANADPAHDMTTNIAPLIRLLEAARRVDVPPTILFSSSGGTVYGKLQEIPVPESHALAPLTAYGAAKAAAELYLNFYRQLYGLDCRIARLANPYGPGQGIAKGQGAVGIFMDLMMRRQPLHVWGDGETTRDYIYIDDAVRGLLSIANAEFPTSSTFNLGSGHALSLNALIAHLQSFVDWKVEVKHEPPRGFDVPISVLDISRARIELNWSPRIAVQFGLRRTFESLLAASRAPLETAAKTLP